MNKQYNPQTLVSYCIFLDVKVQNTNFRKVQTFHSTQISWSIHAKKVMWIIRDKKDIQRAPITIILTY